MTQGVQWLGGSIRVHSMLKLLWSTHSTFKLYHHIEFQSRFLQDYITSWAQSVLRKTNWWIFLWEWIISFEKSITFDRFHQLSSSSGSLQIWDSFFKAEVVGSFGGSGLGISGVSFYIHFNKSSYRVHDLVLELSGNGIWDERSKQVRKIKKIKVNDFRDRRKMILVPEWLKVCFRLNHHSLTCSDRLKMFNQFS